MLQLRDAHREAFNRTAYEVYEEGVVRQLRELFPEQVNAVSDQQIRDRLLSCVPRAQKYGLMTQYQVMCFVDATYLIGDSFDSDPRCSILRDLLTSPLGSEDKADCLLGTATEDLLQ